MQRLNNKQKKKMVADYIECGNYSEVGRRHKVSVSTVRKAVKDSGVKVDAPVEGCPPMFKNVEEIQKRIDAYFLSCEGEMLKNEITGEPVLDKQGNPVYINRKPLTITGLALAIGFATRKTLLEYQSKPQFVYAITRAKSQIEQYTEERLFDRDGVQGAKFSLTNNFKDWSEKQNIGLSGEVVTIIDDL